MMRWMRRSARPMPLCAWSNGSAWCSCCQTRTSLFRPRLVRANSAGVENALPAAEKATVSAKWKWQREYGGARLQAAEGRREEALSTATGLTVMQERTNRAEGLSFQGGV